MITRYVCKKLESSFENLGNRKRDLVKAFCIGAVEGFIDVAMVTGATLLIVGTVINVKCGTPKKKNL